MARYKVQDPGETLDYTQDWTDFLAEGDSIASRVWTIDPDESPSLLSSETTATVKVSGLTRGRTYTLTEQITTASGIVAERSITLLAENT